MSFTFHTTSDPAKIRQVYAVCGTEWGSEIFTPDEFGDAELVRHKYTLDQGSPVQVFYLEDQHGKIVASTALTQSKGFYKDADRSHAISSIPDPALFGVKNVHFLVIGYVFTLKEHRGNGLATLLVGKAIEHTENAIISQKIAESDPAKNDSFKNMVTSDGQVDRQLANYYLGKQYFWVLYSAVGNYYEKFGFKGYPLDFYKVPLSVAGPDQERLIEQLLHLNNAPTQETVGKKLRLLHGSNPADQELIQYILQGKELEIMTELNKLITHSELQGDRRSSSSLANLSDMLYSRRGSSATGLSGITEDVGHSAPRRQSSMVTSTIPKVSIKPSYAHYRGHHLVSMIAAEKLPHKEASTKWFDVNGAIFTNELQHKSYYILWHTLMGKTFFVLGMGELSFEPVGVLGGPAAGGRRRGSSFTGLNELGGHNFQDLDILLSVACHVARQRHTRHDSVVVSTNDLPSHIPGPVLHDYFLNYLPKNFENVHEPGAEADPKSKVEFITDAPTKLLVLPMLKKFGSNSPEFDLDWNTNSMLSWG
ncbi:uncharacterized protein CANTADRAFT_6316 [Suhomyces tanzawaensis NRRL Y-17324]|uniref:N-acetyltransferase domain-containing protein n=1 Tax=Suhomyces tanzawaensis NRRL Y-17324 TaxID=984487 RepID=A0A1E4SI96_9ASCO|nr:uncharacterized protein CANTADRAFT_6316 [Suhomyces tanzawaensis NRRL Y-17324]ODV79142.1 hypothetical protein CANTADRAFT_6316 [Suhomyces tanzawaensis NRRL Y-17324]